MWRRWGLLDLLLHRHKTRNAFLDLPKLYFCLKFHDSILADRFVPIPAVYQTVFCQLSVQVCWSEVVLVDSDDTFQVGQVTHIIDDRQSFLVTF